MYWFFFFQLMLICSSSLYYSSTFCSRSSFTPLLPIFYLYALFFQITYSAGYLVVINQPHSPHSFQRGNTPDRDALFSFPVAGKIELLQMQVEQEHGGTGSKQQYQPCLLVPLHMRGEAGSRSVPSRHPGGALRHVNRSPVSFGSCLLLEWDHTFSVNIALLIANVEMGILQVK